MSRLSFSLSIGCLVVVALTFGCRESSENRVSRPASDDRVSSVPRFADVTTAAGVGFTHEVGAERRYFFPEIMGSGAAFIDYDNDGDLDIYLLNAGTPPDASSASDSRKSPTNRLFRQEADGHFVDVTVGSGLDDPSFRLVDLIPIGIRDESAAGR